jgi:hypothetical protein
MPALQEAEGAGVAFSKPGERIVEAYATGRAGPEEVRRFYEQTLPQLGWVAERLPEADRMRFHRSDERLEMTMERSNGLVTVHFSLSPR